MADKDEKLERILALEEKLTYVEQSYAELNKVAFEQHQKIAKLEDELIALGQKLKEIEESGSGTLPHEQPPHY